MDRVGRVEAPPPLTAAFMCTYRLIIARGSVSGFCEGVPRQILLLGLLVMAGAAHEHYSLTKQRSKQERTTLYSTTSDRQRARMKQENVCKSNGMASTYYVTSISVRKTGWWAVFGFRFSTASAEDFSQTNGNRLVGAPGGHFRQKRQNPNFYPISKEHFGAKN